MRKMGGFSLIELIVVITIIAVITAIGAVNFGGVNKKSRDSKRMADLERIRMALEVVRQVGTSYPATASIGILQTGGYLTQYPITGPKGDSYVYTRDPTSPYAYTLDAWMEAAGGAALGTFCPDATKPCNYRVTQP